MTMTLVLHVAAVAVLVYGVTESRLLRTPRVAIFRWAYRRAGADFEDGTWETGFEFPAPTEDDPEAARAETYAESTADHRWDAYVHEDDDPPFYAVLLICRWCTGLYLSALWTLLWVATEPGWSALWESPTVVAGLCLAGVVGSVLVHAVIASLKH